MGLTGTAIRCNFALGTKYTSKGSARESLKVAHRALDFVQIDQRQTTITIRHEVEWTHGEKCIEISLRMGLDETEIAYNADTPKCAIL